MSRIQGNQTKETANIWAIMYPENRRNFQDKQIKFMENTQQTPCANNTNMPCNDDFYRHFKGTAQRELNTNFDYNYESDAIRYLESYGTVLSPVICAIEHDISNRNFTVDEIKSSIYLLHNNKSPGIDCIPSEFLKHCREVLSDDITQMFNYIIEHRDFPETWTEGLRSPIFKSGDCQLSRYYGTTDIWKVIRDSSTEMYGICEWSL